ncbi:MULTISPECIES: DUF4942 domain-containing protein [Vibrio harveyi group]|uniref:DUF4942 domain-containing protein n=1 Tax=Vibrio owensii CAIM 1854 = LMG 25443 TaxID=1229493 RepID=A0A0C1Z7S6_9VIBR|nr:DUF4942 domain-containing protein [Vibrio owensii]KIF53035.1 hypothetical protein H735_08790 [Vibrio owensii CAIM 1854 = LMG 25443]
MLPVQSKLIEELVQEREVLISSYLESIRQVRVAMEAANKIESLIPTYNRSFIDSFDRVFIALADKIGENTKSRALPSACTLAKKSESDLKKLVIQTVDSELWDVLMNRTGVYGLMSKRQRKEFRNDAATNPLKFNCSNAEATLVTLLNNSSAIGVNALADTVLDLSISYRSNDKFKFQKRTVIENSYIWYGDKLKPDDGPLKLILDYLARIIFKTKVTGSDLGVHSSFLWKELEEAFKEAGDDLSLIEDIYLHGIHLRFFKKKTCHVQLPDEMVNELNRLLSESTMALPERQT